MAEEEDESHLTYSAEEQEVLEIWRRMRLTSDDDKKAIAERASTPSTYRGNIVTNAHSNADINAHALASIPSGGASDWIVDSGAFQHVTGAYHEFHTYTHLETFESIQTADGTAQPVVGKDSLKCTKSMTLCNVLHALIFCKSVIH